MRRVLLAAAVFLAGFVPAAGGARAAWGCTSRLGATIGNTYCHGGGYYVKVGCRHIDGGWTTRYVTGPYRTNGGVSEASCRGFGISYRAVSAGTAHVY